MKSRESVERPTKMELIVLRFIIITGVISMGALLYCLFRPMHIGYAPLYWLLMVAVIFSCLKVLHEWYHYFYITIPPVPVSRSKPTVDILTTFCAGEPYDMIVETLTAIQAITYPHTAYLCDEANDPFLIETCRKLGVIHVTRNNRLNAKAGNINNALHFATGELCVILDPDHVPDPDFLDVVVPYFDDRKVGFVQIVQAYSNIGESTIAKGAAQQTFQFYGPMMMTMNKYGTVLAIGANCTFRRCALDSIGGHAAGLAEDMHTAMQLHAKGWKSVYVPAVLTLGLVPSTLSAYYKQQLKWARGTFELLVTSYPKLFRQFTWRQKLHYASIPFHYFSGVIFFINFLVPVLSLSLGVIPFRFDLLSFTMIGLPFVSAVILARHFVQRWVMAEHERGFHVVGGLLLIGTWWIFIIGLVYTIIRKKVPYIPTPKDNQEDDNWKLLLPNVVVLFVTMAAIIYGLWLDWTPYSWVMAAIASVNCLIMLFNIQAARWNRQENKERPDEPIALFFYYLDVLKINLWKFRHGLYVVMRKVAMPLTLFVCGVTLWFLSEDAKVPASQPFRSVLREQVFYTGIFSPADNSGLTSMPIVNAFNKMAGSRFNIISCYISWGENARCYLSDSLMHAIYRAGAIPLITWEPWASLFSMANNDASLGKEQKMMYHISQGYFDKYLEKFALQVKSLRRPVYIRFGHEPDNPAYPWSARGLNTPQEYVAAWRYVHDFFDRLGARNVVWVWNPWKPDAAKDYFPGKQYVDWLAVSMLNYGSMNPDGRWYSFKQLYTPFHNIPLFRSGLPVIVAELGSLATAGKQQQWFYDAFHDMRFFKEVKAMVIFNNSFDKNTPSEKHNGVLDWRLQKPAVLLAKFKMLQRNDDSNIKPLALLLSFPQPKNSHAGHLPDTTRGIIYSNGIPWFRNLHTLTRREVQNDLSEMQRLGINTIRRYGPGVYDHNIFAVARQVHMKVQYGFWMPDLCRNGKYEGNNGSFQATVIATVKSKKNDPSIIGWHLGNNSWAAMERLYVKPALLTHRDEYLEWLKELVHQIRLADPTRPVTVDIPSNKQVNVTLQTFSNALPEVAAFGIAAPSDTSCMILPTIDKPYFISGVNADKYITLNDHQPVFINAWQDLQTRDAVTFNGLVDHWGRYKPAYFELYAYWKKGIHYFPLPPVKILRPAQVTVPGVTLSYHALTYKDPLWMFGSGDHTLQFQWFLCKTDTAGKAIYMRPLGKGASIDVVIPQEPQHYHLYLVATVGKFAVTAQSTLNTP